MTSVLLSDRLFAGFIRANADGFFDGRNEDLTVSDFAGFC